MIHFFSSNPYFNSVQFGNNFCQKEICLFSGLASVTQAATSSAPSVAPVFQNVHPDVKMLSDSGNVTPLVTNLLTFVDHAWREPQWSLHHPPQATSHHLVELPPTHSLTSPLLHRDPRGNSDLSLRNQAPGQSPSADPAAGDSASLIRLQQWHFLTEPLPLMRPWHQPRTTGTSSSRLE